MQTWGNALAALASGMSEGVARKRERKRQATLDEERRAAIERQQEAQDVAASRAAQLFPLQLQEAQLGLKSQQGTLDAQTAADAERQRQLGLQEGVPHPVKALIIADADRLAKEGWPVERIGIYLDGKYGRAVVLHHLGVAGNGPTAPSPTPAPIGQGQFQTSPVQFGGGSAAEGQTPSMSASGLGAFLPPEGANRVYTADQQALTKVIAAGLKDSSIQPEEAEPIWNARFKGVPMPAELSAIGPTATSAAALARTAAAENAKTIEFMMKAYQGLIDGKFPPAVAAKYGKRIWDQLVLQKVVPAGMEMPDFAAISAFESPAERATELWKRANFALTPGEN